VTVAHLTTGPAGAPDEAPVLRVPAVRDLPVPPREGVGGFARRLWRARRQLSPLQYWMSFVAGPASLVFSGLCVGSGAVNGWRTSYDVALAITSPWDRTQVRVVLIAVPLSLAGYLLVPAFLGAIVAHLVTRAIEQQRQSTAEEIAALLRHEVALARREIAAVRPEESGARPAEDPVGDHA
jgi:hypothetical protein